VELWTGSALYPGYHARWTARRSDLASPAPHAVDGQAARHPSSVIPIRRVWYVHLRDALRSCRRAPTIMAVGSTQWSSWWSWWSTA